MTQETLSLLGAEVETTQLRFVVAENYYDKDHVRDVVREIRQILEQYGYFMERYAIPDPGKHPHEGQLRSPMFLQLIFGILALFLSCFLLINMIHALLASQIRQIGIIKAVGGNTTRIILLYLSSVLVLSLLALGLALPVGIEAGKATARFVAGMLNFDILTGGIPLYAWVLMIALSPGFTPISESCTYCQSKRHSRSGGLE